MLSRKPIALFAAIVVLFMGFALTANPVSAAARTTLTSLSVGCSSATFTFTTGLKATEITGYRSTSTSSETFVIPVSGTGPQTISVNYNQAADGGQYIYLSFSITSPSYSNIFYGIFYCDREFEGPSVPAGWVQRWMGCSTPVFDAPGGKPIGDLAVWAGQSFSVNPVPTLDDAGKSWSQVYVSSYTSPWIPTSCLKK